MISSSRHEQLRHELERSALLVRAAVARRHRSIRLAALGVVGAGFLGAAVVLFLLLFGPGERAEAPPAPPILVATPPTPQRRVISQPEPPRSVPDSAPPFRRPTVLYTVRRGDTLARIAVRHGVPVDQIVADNRLADPRRLAVGQRLVLITSTPAGVEVIRPGSTLSEYARRHGVRVADLLALNPSITDPNRIRAGDRLVVTAATR